MKKLLWTGLTLAILAGAGGCSTAPDDEGTAAAPPPAAAATPASNQTASAGDAVFGKYIQQIGRELIMRRDSAMKALIEMDEGESERFWAVKAEYEAELGRYYDDRLTLIAEFSEVHDKLTRELATDLAGRALDFERRRTDLHEKYFNRMADEISPVVAVQWLQLETQFESMADVKIAEGVPLAIR